MNKLHLLASTSLIAALLTGCASNPPVPESGEPPAPADSATSMDTNSPNNNAAKAATDSMGSQQAGDQPTASIKLSQKNDQIIAKVSTNWVNAKQGDLYLKWVAPKGTTCHSTQLPITKYEDSNDISSAKRPVTSLYTDQACNGMWKVQVTTKNGAIVADETINIASAQSGS